MSFFGYLRKKAMGLADAVIAQLEISHILLGLLLIAVVYYFLRDNHNLPPGPTNLPVVGCLPFLGKQANVTFSKWSEKYGPVIYVRLGKHSTVVLNSYEAIVQAFVKQSSDFNGRFRTFFTDFSYGGDYGIIFLNNQENWKIQRRFGLRGLSGANLQGKSLEARIREEVELLCEDIRAKEGKPFVLEGDLTHSIANIINGITIQQRCNDKGNERLLAYVDHVINGFRRNGFLFILLTVMPWVRYLPNVARSIKRIQVGIRDGNALFDDIIEERKETLDPLKPNGFIDSFLVEHTNQAHSFEKKEQLRMFLKDLFAAGTETSSSTLRWILVYLIRRPDVQKKVHDEIDRVIGREGVARLDADVPFVKAVIQETYRVQTLVPLGVPRRTIRDTTLLGYHIPKNTQVLANIWHVHNNPKHWPNPREFIPERHIDESGKFVKSDHVIPFSIGPRNCLGENLARKEIFLFFVCLMQKFEVLPNPDNPNPSMEGTPGPVYSSHHYPLIMKER